MDQAIETPQKGKHRRGTQQYDQAQSRIHQQRDHEGRQTSKQISGSPDEQLSVSCLQHLEVSEDGREPVRLAELKVQKQGHSKLSIEQLASQIPQRMTDCPGGRPLVKVPSSSAEHAQPQGDADNGGELPEGLGG